MDLATRFGTTALLLLAVCNNGSPQETLTTGPAIHNGFLKAQTYLEMDAEQQRIYIMGPMDGMYLAPTFGAPATNKILMRIEKCVEGMKGSQVAAIVLKYAKDHPQHWHWDLKDVVYNATLDACPAAPN